MNLVIKMFDPLGVKLCRRFATQYLNYLFQRNREPVSAEELERFNRGKLAC